MTSAKFHSTSDVSEQAVISSNVVVWANTQVRENASIGANTSLGIGVYIGPGVEIGRNCKIQNYALIYEPAKLADGVFIGPGVIFTNDKLPRAITPSGKFKNSNDWVAEGVEVGFGASVGAGAICVAPVRVGEWAVIAAGSVVVKEVLRYELVAGVPARHLGWVSESGVQLEAVEDYFLCPKTQKIYRLVDGMVQPDDNKHE
jgi:UDP-2-acetamido-3-amino-2,3-dideoxy-glucuronate N-acetyltransferase